MGYFLKIKFYVFDTNDVFFKAIFHPEFWKKIRSRNMNQTEPDTSNLLDPTDADAFRLKPTSKLAHFMKVGNSIALLSARLEVLT